MSDAVSVAEHTAAAGARTDGRSRRGLLRRPAAVAGLAGASLIVAAAVFAPVLAPHSASAQNLGNILAPPFWAGGGSFEHPLGTDALGRDVASRLLFGARNSLLISVAAMLIGSGLGLAAGLAAGFVGGRTDAVIMRVGDVQLAFPFILLAIAVLGVIPNRTVLHLIVVLGIPGWIVYARVVRSRVLAEREKDYVHAARALGASAARRLFRYVLPSTWQVVPVIAMLDVGFLVIMESTLSFLGIGLPPPAASWGSMLAEGRRNMIVSPWLPVLPGLAIMATVLAINLAADGLADLLDPRLRKGGFRRLVLRGMAPGVARQHEGEPAAGPGAQPAARIGAQPAALEEEALLEVRDLHVDFPADDRVVRAVRGISFSLRRGRTLGIVGESGSGKSVTAYAIIQLLDAPGRVTAGEIRFDGQDVTRITDARMAALRGRRIGMIFQNPAASLNPVLSIGFQMREAIRRHRPPTAHDPPSAKPSAAGPGRGTGKLDPDAVARAALRAVGIGDPERVLRQYPFQLSGGMNQRVMIALAMIARPDLLIADEPTTALDVTTQSQILDELRRVTREHGTAMLLITHDIALVAEHADEVLVMYAGQVCEVGAAEQVIDNPGHPYTRALLESVPRADLPVGARLQAIPGELPDPAAQPRGCPFAPRCPAVMDVCRDVAPAPIAIAPGHHAACHLWSRTETEVHA